MRMFFLVCIYLYMCITFINLTTRIILLAENQTHDPENEQMRYIKNYSCGLSFDTPFNYALVFFATMKHCVEVKICGTDLIPFSS